LKIWKIYVEELYDLANLPENLNVEPEEGSHILRSEVEKAFKEMRDKKATGGDDVPVETLKLLGDDGLILLTKLINNIYESGEWPKDFTEVTMAASKKKPKARKCTDHRTISLIAHAAKVVISVIRRRSEKKIEDVLREDQFGFRKGKGTRDAMGMLRILLEQTLDIGEEICICFIDWQKAFDRVKWTKLTEIYKKTGIDWRE
jgi:hypothetical protein